MNRRRPSSPGGKYLHTCGVLVEVMARAEIGHPCTVSFIAYLPWLLVHLW